MEVNFREHFISILGSEGLQCVAGEAWGADLSVWFVGVQGLRYRARREYFGTHPVGFRGGSCML